MFQFTVIVLFRSSSNILPLPAQAKKKKPNTHTRDEKKIKWYSWTLSAGRQNEFPANVMPNKISTSPYIYKYTFPATKKFRARPHLQKYLCSVMLCMRAKKKVNLTATWRFQLHFCMAAATVARPSSLWCICGRRACSGRSFFLWCGRFVVVVVASTHMRVEEKKKKYYSLERVAFMYLYLLYGRENFPGLFTCVRRCVMDRLYMYS